MCVETYFFFPPHSIIYSQSHGCDIFESSKLKGRTSLLPRFSEKRRSSSELLALKQHSKMSPWLYMYSFYVVCIVVVSTFLRISLFGYEHGTCTSVQQFFFPRTKFWHELTLRRHLWVLMQTPVQTPVDCWRLVHRWSSGGLGLG